MKRGLYFIGILLIFMCCGCGTARQNFYAGQGFDLSITYYGLEIDGNYKEINPFADDFEDVLIMKIVVVGVIELAAYLDPDNAKVYYVIGSVVGYMAGSFNTYMLIGKYNR